MREDIERNLCSAVDSSVVRSLLTSYEKIVIGYRRGDLDSCLIDAGKFVEHTLRAIEHVRTGHAPAEIKNLANVIQQIERDQTLPDGLGAVMPRVAAMIYAIRSKRGAVHVKELDPRRIDAELCTHAASWIVAELLRLFHSDAEDAVAKAMAALVRPQLPMIEFFGREAVVTGKVPCSVELLLLIGNSAPDGIDRRTLGTSSKFPPPTVTRTLQGLQDDVLVHRTKDGRYHVTAPGQQFLSTKLAERRIFSLPTAAAE